MSGANAYATVILTVTHFGVYDMTSKTARQFDGGREVVYDNPAASAGGISILSSAGKLFSSIGFGSASHGASFSKISDDEHQFLRLFPLAHIETSVEENATLAEVKEALLNEVRDCRGLQADADVMERWNAEEKIFFSPPEKFGFEAETATHPLSMIPCVEVSSNKRFVTSRLHHLTLYTSVLRPSAQFPNSIINHAELKSATDMTSNHPSGGVSVQIPGYHQQKHTRNGYTSY